VEEGAEGVGLKGGGAGTGVSPLTKPAGTSQELNPRHDCLYR
jgi:hypothetical protein